VPVPFEFLKDKLREAEQLLSAMERRKVLLFCHCFALAHNGG
jgi:hypothetical protein